MNTKFRSGALAAVLGLTSGATSAQAQFTEELLIRADPWFSVRVERQADGFAFCNARAHSPRDERFSVVVNSRGEQLLMLYDPAVEPAQEPTRFFVEMDGTSHIMNGYQTGNTHQAFLMPSERTDLIFEQMRTAQTLTVRWGDDQQAVFPLEGLDEVLDVMLACWSEIWEG